MSMAIDPIQNAGSSNSFMISLTGSVNGMNDINQVLSLLNLFISQSTNYSDSEPYYYSKTHLQARSQFLKKNKEKDNQLSTSNVITHHSPFTISSIKHESNTSSSTPSVPTVPPSTNPSPGPTPTSGPSSQASQLDRSFVQGVQMCFNELNRNLFDNKKNLLSGPISPHITHHRHYSNPLFDPQRGGLSSIRQIFIDSTGSASFSNNYYNNNNNNANFGLSSSLYPKPLGGNGLGLGMGQPEKLSLDLPAWILVWMGRPVNVAVNKCTVRGIVVSHVSSNYENFLSFMNFKRQYEFCQIGFSFTHNNIQHSVYLLYKCVIRDGVYSIERIHSSPWICEIRMFCNDSLIGQYSEKLLQRAKELTCVSFSKNIP